MKCLMKYQWVKLPRNHLPEGKGIMNAWAKLASRAAFRKGQASYCGHINAVSPGMWSGGVVGLKSILGSRSRVKSLEALSKLSELGYISYSLNAKTKKLTYQITDWVIKCSGEECMDGTVYATEGYGFLCLPRNITDRLVEQQYIIFLMKQTHGLTSGATRYQKILTMRFLFWHRLLNLASSVPY